MKSLVKSIISNRWAELLWVKILTEGIFQTITVLITQVLLVVEAFLAILVIRVVAEWGLNVKTWISSLMTRSLLLEMDRFNTVKINNNLKEHSKTLKLRQVWSTEVVELKFLVLQLPYLTMELSIMEVIYIKIQLSWKNIRYLNKALLRIVLELEDRKMQEVIYTELVEILTRNNHFRMLYSSTLGLVIQWLLMKLKLATATKELDF